MESLGVGQGLDRLRQTPGCMNSNHGEGQDFRAVSELARYWEVSVNLPEMYNSELVPVGAGWDQGSHP